MINTDDEFFDEMNEYVEETVGVNIELIVENLMTVHLQSRLKHWNVTGDGSFAEHDALGVFYTDLDTLLDDLVECVQGVDGRLLNFSDINVSFKKDMIFELTQLKDMVNGYKHEDGGINNILDDIRTLISKTLYKLKFLS